MMGEPSEVAEGGGGGEGSIVTVYDVKQNLTQ